jgi:site-specific DNA-methyltransferase (adenine-specific)
MKPYYDEGGITIYHGDCRDVLASLDVAADLLLADPPYGMQFSGQSVTSVQANISADGVRHGVRVLRQAMFEAVPRLALDAHLLLFCHWQSWPDFYDALGSYTNVKNALIWHKKAGGQGNIRADYIRDYEVILYGRIGNRPIGGEGSYSNVLTGFTRPGADRHHPTEKPYALLSHLIERHCPAGGLVLDPFMGGGSMLVAAKERGRKAIGIEIEERYCEIAANRLAQEVLAI